jgi:hypothetical protein
MGLLCEECRQKIFYVKSGFRSGGEDDLAPIQIKAHFNHYSTKAKQFCSRRTLSGEGRTAYKRVLHPIARGQWLDRFQQAAIYAITCDPVEPVLGAIRRKMKDIGLGEDAPMTADAIQKAYGVPMNPDGTFTLKFDSDTPAFRDSRSTPVAVAFGLTDGEFMDNTCEVSRAADFRKMMHDAIDAAWAELEVVLQQSKIKVPEGAVPTPRGSKDKAWRYWQAYIRYALAHQDEGGLTAQRYCAHLALDFLLAEPQDAALRELLTDCLGAFEWAGVRTFKELVSLSELAQRQGLGLGKEHQNVQQTLGVLEKIGVAGVAQEQSAVNYRPAIQLALNELQVDLLKSAAQKIGVTPWQHVWEAAVAYAKKAKVRRQEQEERLAKAEQRLERQQSGTRGLGFG